RRAAGGDSSAPVQTPKAPGAPHPPAPPGAPGGARSITGETGEQPFGVPGARGGGAPFDLATAGPPAGGVPPQSARNAAAAGGVLATVPPSQTPPDGDDIAYGYCLRNDTTHDQQDIRRFFVQVPR